MANAYAGRSSASTRNPHIATKASNFFHLDTEDRILEQWRAAFGCPVSDEAKAQFAISAAGRTFNLSDVRLWTQQHPQNPAAKGSMNKGKIHLEFFFDGSHSELAGTNEEAFTKAFENMIEQQLQERRVVEFRKKLAARRRVKGGSSGAEATGDSATEPSAFDGGDPDYINDSDWQNYLQRPIPAADFSMRSFREAGCMITFLVCQTSLSIGASEVLGQIAFQEHFPIDGKQQDPSASTKPLPRWVYGVAGCTAVLATLTLGAWYQAVRQGMMIGAEGALVGA